MPVSYWIVGRHVGQDQVEYKEGTDDRLDHWEVERHHVGHGCIAIWPRGNLPCCLRREGTFADPSDSGTIVLKIPEGKLPHELKWVGLLFVTTEANNIEYIVLIGPMMNDIREVTGCDVVEPVAV